ncbi:hypothetical protein JCM10296v2_001514 [Rhodotorula toruloides]
MTSLQTHTKPSLHLSLTPNSGGPSHASTSTPSSSSRRVPSWGSAASDTFSRISAMGDRSLEPLPSPLESREWGFLPESSLRAGDSARLGGTGGSWLDGWGGSIGTSGGKGEAGQAASSGGSWMSSGASASGGSWMSSGPSEFGAFPSVSTPTEEKGEGRQAPKRNKTLSFFDTGSEDSSRALSPPPNPPSRQNSLSSGHRRGPSSSSAPPPSPGWESLYQPALDPLRSSVASSTSSWLDEASGEGTNVPWTRGRGGSIGSTAGARSVVDGLQTPRNESPRRMEEEEPSPVAALRPRLAALETSSIQPGFGSPSPVNFPSKPLSSLPTAVDPPRSRFYDLTTAPSSVASSSCSSSRRQFVSLDEQPSPADSPPRSARSSGETPRSPSRQPQQQQLDEVDSSPAVQVGDRLGDYVIDRLLGKGAFSRVALARMSKGKERATGYARTASRDAGADGGLVALKMIGKKGCESNERMRISVMREVEVLKNVLHPSLVSLFTSFSTPQYTVLVLEYCAGGELFDFIADWHHEMTDGLAKRIFGELCSAVGWMHEIGLVHRDIKLENILLTCRPFPCPDSSSLLSSLPTPLVKLTDFGLSRFINPASPLLSTRCGSEEYAAPELIMGKRYDGRKTDAWALGVVLYALITGVMPFVQGAGGRRGYLLKIAKADWRWPGLARSLSVSSVPPDPRALNSPPQPASSAPLSRHASISSSAAPSPPALTPSTPAASSASSRLVSPAVQTVVARLLVRDPARRAAVSDLWDLEWLRGETKVAGRVRRVAAEDWARRGSELFE